VFGGRTPYRGWAIRAGGSFGAGRAPWIRRGCYRDRTTTAQAGSADRLREGVAVIEQVSSRIVYQNAWMTVREDEIRRSDGAPGIYGVIVKPPSALIVPFADEGFWLVEQYRYAVGGRFWEFPQGTMPDRSDAEPAAVARHELAQETGLGASELRWIGRFFHAYGMSDQACNVWLATGLSPDPDAAAPDPEESDLISRWFERREVEKMIREGVITDLATVAAFGLLLLDPLFS
jgi:ADP-ribose pyrophosphatase